MKQFALLTALAVMGLPALSQAANPQQVNACVTQVTDKNITDKKSAQKFCSCVVDVQSSITQAQKTELDQWVKSGKDVRTNKTFQSVTAKFKACGNGIKFNQAKPQR